MNERIRELAEQAWDYVASCDDQYSKSATDLFEEKFAELIVKETKQIAKEYQNRGGNCYVDNMIAEHFGVKE